MRRGIAVAPKSRTGRQAGRDQRRLLGVKRLRGKWIEVWKPLAASRKAKNRNSAERSNDVEAAAPAAPRVHCGDDDIRERAAGAFCESFAELRIARVTYRRGTQLARPFIANARIADSDDIPRAHCSGQRDRCESHGTESLN